MKSLFELVKSLYGPKAISGTLGTRTNVIRLPSGKLQRYLKEDLNIEQASDAAAKNAYNEMQQLIPDIAKMNDAERLIFEGNLRRLKNKLEASGLIPKTKVEGEVIGMESKEKITGEDLKKLTEEKGTVNPPTTIAGQLEQSAKKMENLGKNIEQEFTCDTLIGGGSIVGSIIATTNSTGGSERETIESIRFKAPKFLSGAKMIGCSGGKLSIIVFAFELVQIISLNAFISELQLI